MTYDPSQERIVGWLREYATEHASETIGMEPAEFTAWHAATLIERQAAEIARLRDGGWRPIDDAARNEGEMVGVLLSDGTTDYAYWWEWEETVPEYHGTTGEYLGRSVQDGGAAWMVHSSGPCLDPTMADFDPAENTIHVVKWCRLPPLPSTKGADTPSDTGEA